jgi:hypothetical protein
MMEIPGVPGERIAQTPDNQEKGDVLEAPENHRESEQRMQKLHQVLEEVVNRYREAESRRLESRSEQEMESDASLQNEILAKVSEAAETNRPIEREYEMRHEIKDDQTSRPYPSSVTQPAAVDETPEKTPSHEENIAETKPAQHDTEQTAPVHTSAGTGSSLYATAVQVGVITGLVIALFLAVSLLIG